MARSFNGTSDQIDCGASGPSLTSAANFTIAGWVFPTLNNTNYKGLFGWDNAAHSQNCIIFLSSTNFRYYVSFTNVDPGSATVTLNVWQHVALTYDGTTLRAFLNGVSDGTSALSGTVTTASDFGIGNDLNTASRFFGGNIADVAAWNTNLSAGNITSLVKGVRPVGVNSANLIGWWPLDGYASPETDLSSGGNNGVLTGTARVLGPPALWRISG